MKRKTTTKKFRLDPSATVKVGLFALAIFGVATLGFSQNFNGVTQAGANAVQQEVAGVKQIVKYVMFMLAAGAFAYAAWAFFYRPEESTKRIGGLIGGLVCAAVGVALQFLA